MLAGKASARGLPPHSCQGDLREGSISHSSGSFLGASVIRLANDKRRQTPVSLPSPCSPSACR